MELDLVEIGRRTDKNADEVAHLFAQAKDSMIPKGKQIAVTEDGATRWFIVTRRGVGLIRTDFGEYDHLIDYRITNPAGEIDAVARTVYEQYLLAIEHHP